MLTENVALYESLSARTNLSFFGSLYSVPSHRLLERTEELLDFFELREAADRQVATFSKGMKQRLALARALIHDPEILYLDEPTANLDPEASRTVVTLIQRLASSNQTTIFMATHNLHEAQVLCSRVMMLDAGRCLTVDTPANLIAALGSSKIVITFIRQPPPELAAQVSAQQQVLDLQADGLTYTVTVRDAQVVPEVIKTIVQANGQIYSVVPEAKTLTDVYFALRESVTQARTLNFCNTKD